VGLSKGGRFRAASGLTPVQQRGGRKTRTRDTRVDVALGTSSAIRGERAFPEADIRSLGRHAIRVQSIPWMIELSAEEIYTDGIPPINLQLRTNTLTKGHLTRYVYALN
jgi:hypothetical protein